MDDLSAKLSQILGSEEGMAQLRGMASALGLTGDGQNQNPPSPAQPSVPEQSGTKGVDFSALANMLSQLMNGENQAPPVAPPAAQASSPDLSGLMNTLSGLIGGGGGGSGTQASSPMPSLPNIDISTILTLQKAYAAFTSRDKNTELLLALRPHFTQERQKKVDDAIRILGLIKILPLLKDSGILGSLGGLLGGDGS